MAARLKGFPPKQDLSGLFKASSIRQLAAGRPTPLLISIAREYSPELSGGRLREVLDLAHRSLGQARRSEYFYKNLLIKKLVFGVFSPKTTSVFSEFRVADCRADLLLVNSRATVYEIKSELDDLSKAQKQAFAYLQCFTEVNFVVDRIHVDGAKRQLPREVGICAINDRAQIATLRRATATEKYLSKRSIFNCLVLSEYQELLGELGGGAPIEYAEAMRLLDPVPPIELQRYLVRCLRGRAKKSVQDIGWGSIPPSLLAAAYSYQMSAAQWRSVIAVLDTPLSEVL